MRSLGEFFGHIAHAVRSDAAEVAPGTQPKDTGEPPVPQADSGEPPDPQAAQQIKRQTVEEKQIVTPAGKVTLRRTVIDEVELPRDEG